MEYHSGRYNKGTAAFESHEVVSTEAGGPADSGEIETVTAYMYVSYDEYVLGENGVYGPGGAVDEGDALDQHVFAVLKL